MTPTLKMQLSRHVDTSGGPDTCWPWTGPISRWGYGRAYMDVDGRRVETPASRAAFIEARGPLEDGVFVLHSCDNPPCCNPAHLRPGSHADNMADRKRRGRYPRGAQVPPEVAAQIRAEYARHIKGRGTPSLARRFGISRSTVQRIVTGTESRPRCYPKENVA